ncbi:MAG TPA: RNA-binding protein [Chitinophaga sp.]|uniref:RNA recognition motif domain-containing protein n=1 Tax=Chitinophaga sp. TaxID=1869181 RepID=UPI002BFF9863|nr:RNA-binding protein [Chitinophaga sp.]HVI46073.1 RNA-binding protein [Chitinophaga sp.]
MNIFVGNLSHQVSEKQLHDLFAEFGVVKSVKIVTDNYTWRPKGFAFVEMEERAAGEKAVEMLHNTRVFMQSIVVNEAHPKNSQSENSSSRYNKPY